MKDHTVEYISMDHYMKSEKMQEHSKKMAEMGMPTCATPRSTNEEAQQQEQMRRNKYIHIFMD